MFKRLMLIVATCMTFFSTGALAQSSFAMGVATGVPIGTYGAAGAAVNTMLMAEAADEEARAVAAMTPEERAAYQERGKKLAGELMWFLYVLGAAFFLMAFMMEPVWSMWLALAIGAMWVVA